MLERKISDDLLEWKRSGTGKALLLTGARQIGKSYAVREFAKHEYAHYLEINVSPGMSVEGENKVRRLMNSCTSFADASARAACLFSYRLFSR